MIHETPSDTDSQIDCYKKKDVVGKGTYGVVWRAKKGNETVALKLIQMENEQEGFPITAIREIRILKELRHDNVVKLIHIVTTKMDGATNPKEAFAYLVFEYMEYDMAGLMDSKTNMNDWFTMPQIKCFFRQLLEGLRYLHKNNILHRDIKASNLLINNKGILKLADFGLARPISDYDPKKYTNKVVTLWYRPPELLLGAYSYGPEIDMWSAGCILAELLLKKAVFPGKNEIEQLNFIYQITGTPTAEDAKSLPSHNSMQTKGRQYPKMRETFIAHGEYALEILENLLALDPKKRMTADKALISKYLWSDPLPCKPQEIPFQVESSHEFTAENKRRQRQSDILSSPKRVKYNNNHRDTKYEQRDSKSNDKINHSRNYYNRSNSDKNINRQQDYPKLQIPNNKSANTTTKTEISNSGAPPPRPPNLIRNTTKTNPPPRPPR